MEWIKYVDIWGVSTYIGSELPEAVDIRSLRRYPWILKLWNVGLRAYLDRYKS